MGKRKSGRDVHGILLLDKRLGVSSNKALQEVRRLFDANKAGHTGSLDPLATGLLPLCFGEATKVSALLLDGDKRYQVTVQLGVVTDTGDAEGQIIARHPVPVLLEDDLRNCLQRFVGEIEQVPPMYSALKHQGKKLYELARAGQVIDRQPRKIRIHQLVLLGATADSLQLDVSCSKGTYIRSLAEDIGSALGCGGTVTVLRRIGVGDFGIGQAHTLEQLQAMDAESLQQKLLPVDWPLQALPMVHIEQAQAEKVNCGQPIALTTDFNGPVRIYCGPLFLGLGEMSLNGKLAPKKLFNLT